MNTIQKCPICDSKNSSPIFSIEEFPYFIAPVKKQDKEKILKRYRNRGLQGKLEPAICKKCSHIYLQRLPNARVASELYSEYYTYPSALEGSFLPERDDSFLKIFNEKIRRNLKKDQKRVLEIGCYDGYILYNLKKLGFNVTGCDPSEGAHIGKKFGIDIKKRFFNVSDFLKEDLKYDIVIFRHFLEHLLEPVAFLKVLVRILKPDGMVVFEVPNIKFYLKNINTSVFGFQHLQYFSRESIQKLLRKSDLKLISLTDTGENLIIVCLYGRPAGYCAGKTVVGLCRAFKSKLKKKKMLLKKMLKRFPNKGIVLWGAGGFSGNILEIYGIPRNSIRLIVDSDANKWNMEFLKYSTPIKSPDALRKDSHGCLVISSMYTREIVNKLKDLRYDKPLIKLHPKIELCGKSRNDKKNKN